MTERRATPPAASDPPVTSPDDDAAEHAVRRAPYADNPTVGRRGLQTKQRILDAALVEFAESGYERTTIERLAQLAGCSRASLYQYFSGKDDVFRHLSGVVARRLRSSVEQLNEVTADRAGRDELHAWVRRTGDTFDRYTSVFRVFGAAADTDPIVADGSVRSSVRTATIFETKVTGAAVGPEKFAHVVAPLLAGVLRSLELASYLRLALPDDYTRPRVERALADVVHRGLFGPISGVNVRPSDVPRIEAIPLGSRLDQLFRDAAAVRREATRPGRRSLAALLDIGRDVVVQRGFHGTRVDDLVEAAGVSHGAFYRYFDNKGEFVNIIAAQELGSVSGSLNEVPVLSGDVVERTVQLREWLRRYHDTHVHGRAVLRVWLEAGLGEDLRTDQAAAFDWGRRQLLRLLGDDHVGDVDVDAMLLLAMVDAFGSRTRSDDEFDAMVGLVARSFLDPAGHGA